MVFITSRFHRNRAASATLTQTTILMRPWMLRNGDCTRWPDDEAHRFCNRMIIDVHSHAWSFPEHFTDDFRTQARRARAGLEVDLRVTYDGYRTSAPDDVR